MKRAYVLVFGLLLAVASSATATARVSIVAAENFYGDIVRQIGGDKVSVMSDPNVDPHEYESNVEDAKAIANASLVIANGGGYDDWMDKLLSASPNASRIVLKGFDLAVTKLPDNEHVWYNIDNAATIAKAIDKALAKLDPADSAFFRRNDQTFEQSLSKIKGAIRKIAAEYRGTPIGLTETIFLYQATPLGLKVLTPFEFQKAIAEGNDPPADAVVETENQIKQKKIKILVYNEQTISAVTTKAQDDAKEANVPVVGVTETMPVGESYQTWMLRQLEEVRKALVASSHS